MAAPTGIEPTFCPSDRYRIADLAERIQYAVPDALKDDIGDILYHRVNIENEKITRDHKKAGFTRWNSISAHEASIYIMGLVKKGRLNDHSIHARIGRSMNLIFFAGRLPEFDGSSSSVVVTGYSDADSGYMIRPVTDNCNTMPVSQPFRKVGIDSPETGDYSEELADWYRSTLRGKSPYSELHLDTSLKGKYINGKLVINVDEVHVFLSEGKWDPKKLSFEERAAINGIIAAAIDYTGEIAKIPVNDLLTWRRDHAMEGAATMFGSQVRWSDRYTPKALCGSWEPYDGSGRYLAGFVDDSNRYIAYIRERLSNVMKQEGKIHYDNFLEKAAVHLAVLDKSKNVELKKVAAKIVGGVHSAAVYYSQENCERMARALEGLSKEYGEHVLHDEQVLQLITGSVTDFMKYRSQRSDLYQAVADRAREMGFGFWEEVSFRTLWEFRKDVKKFHPDDCLNDS